MSYLATALGLRPAGAGALSVVPSLAPALLSWQFFFAYGLLSSRTLKQWYGIDHNGSPREDLKRYGDAAVLEGKMTQSQLDMLKRNEAAHANSVENYTLFVAAMGFATFAGVETHLVNRAGVLYVAARIAYAVVYVTTSHDLYSQARGITWWTGNISCLWLFYRAGLKLNRI